MHHTQARHSLSLSLSLSLCWKGSFRETHTLPTEKSLYNKAKDMKKKITILILIRRAVDDELCMVCICRLAPLAPLPLNSFTYFLIYRLPSVRDITEFKLQKKVSQSVPQFLTHSVAQSQGDNKRKGKVRYDTHVRTGNGVTG